MNGWSESLDTICGLVIFIVKIDVKCHQIEPVYKRIHYFSEENCHVVYIVINVILESVQNYDFSGFTCNFKENYRP